MGSTEEHKLANVNDDVMNYSNKVFCLFRYKDLHCGPIHFDKTSVSASIQVTIQLKSTYENFVYSSLSGNNTGLAANDVNRLTLLKCKEVTADSG